MHAVFVTGGTGFIGRHLVEHLASIGIPCGCLVRHTSDFSFLNDLGCKPFHGDVTDEVSVTSAIQQFRPSHIIHVAGLTKARKQHDFSRVNSFGTQAVLEGAANLEQPPVVVLVSSIAAAGPCEPNRLKTETDEPRPISNYGRSKREAEQKMFEMSSRLPISIVRPPIVIGPRDSAGLEMFKPVANLGFHLVPSRSPMRVSWIYVQDLIEAIHAVAERGQRATAMRRDQGLYFSAPPELVDYADFGHHIATTLDRTNVRIVRNPSPVVWAMAAINEGVSWIRAKPSIFGVDKAREATAGSWACDGSKLTRDTGYAYRYSLKEAIALTADWYQKQGWI